MEQSEKEDWIGNEFMNDIKSSVSIQTLDALNAITQHDE